MTLVCVRLEKSFGLPRLTALADTRASIRQTNGTFKTVSDTTEKLFAIAVRCHSIDGLAPVVGAWTNPYFETTIGLGFSGSCFEALTLVAHFSKSLASLVAPNGDAPRPTGEGLLNLLTKLCESYFAEHSGDTDPVVRFLVFGFDIEQPWIGRVAYSKRSGTTSSFILADENTLETIGQDAGFTQRAHEWRNRISKHREEVSSKPLRSHPDAFFDRELELARHDVAEKKATEEEMLLKIDSELMESIGGVLQRLELSAHDGQVQAGFTRDDRDYLNGACFSVAPDTHLGPVPIVQRMGRTEPSKGS